MERLADERLIYEILLVVQEIPEGCVATYDVIFAVIRYPVWKELEKECFRYLNLASSALQKYILGHYYKSSQETACGQSLGCFFKY